MRSLAIALLGVFLVSAHAGRISDQSDSIYGKVAPTQTMPVVFMHYKCSRLDANFLYAAIVPVRGNPVVLDRELLEESGVHRVQLHIAVQNARAKGMAYSRIEMEGCVES